MVGDENMMDAEIIRQARLVPNRGRLHVFLGHPLSDGCDKTTVEPGNVFSPGVWTCGISVWVQVGARVHAPDTVPEADLRWGFAGDEPPVLEARWEAGGVTVESRLAHRGGEGAQGVDFCEVTAVSGAPDAALWLIVRDVGPAGARIAALAWDEDTRRLTVNADLTLTVETAPAQCMVAPADADHDSPVAALRYAVGTEPRRVAFRVEHGFGGRAFADAVPAASPHAGLPVEVGLEGARREWGAALPARVFCPDDRVARVWERSALHLLAGMECGLPRIGAVNYPALWVRDGILVLRAMDLIGRRDLARLGCDALAPVDFSGGFGAEADAPGEGIWALTSHARLTGDADWLAGVFPHIARRVGWLERMRTAKTTLRQVGENRIPHYLNTPGINVLCLPSEDGLIHGRMDWHTPDFYINCWAVAGYREAAWAAHTLGRSAQAEAWRGAEAWMDEAVARVLLPGYGNERDLIVAPHPTGALSGHERELAVYFGEWYRRNRLAPRGERIPEALWTYFEAAQIHNALRLGMKGLAWACLDGMLGDGVPTWAVSAYSEGSPGGNEYLPFSNGAGRRGWLDARTALAGNMPHGWTAAEMLLLLRTIFVREEGDGLILGEGVPGDWLHPGACFGVRDLPTDFGPVTYTVTMADDGAADIDYDGPKSWRPAFPSRPPHERGRTDPGHRAAASWRDRRSAPPLPAHPLPTRDLGPDVPDSGPPKASGVR